MIPLNSSFANLLLLRILFGVGAGIVLPMTSAMVAQWFSPKELPLINGINVASQSVGVAISMFLAVPVGSLLGWQWVFCIFGIFTFGGFVLWLFVGREKSIVALDHAMSGGKKILLIAQQAADNVSTASVAAALVDEVTDVTPQLVNVFENLRLLSGDLNIGVGKFGSRNDV